MAGLIGVGLVTGPLARAWCWMGSHYTVPTICGLYCIRCHKLLQETR